MALSPASCLGLALTDVGAITYNYNRYVLQAQLANQSTVQLGQLDTLRVRNANDLAPIAKRLVGVSGQNTEFSACLPTAVRLTADYRVLDHVYAGVLWTQNLLPAKTIGQRVINSLAFTPRVEFSHAEIAVPVILANNYQKLQVGALVRLGPLFVGSDNLGGLLNLTSTTGADVYFGLGLGLHKRKYQDKDKDQVSNKLDKCPTVKGVWEFQGCPDRDHVQDAVDDACPKTPGPAANKGCPIGGMDGDGTPDKKDACPRTPGPASNNGCPVLLKEEAKVLNTAFSTLEFETGKAVIKERSFASLDELATLLKAKPAFRLRLSGHTDNQGKPAKNLLLSKQRTLAVSRYLVQQGVPATQIKSQWFGQTKPKASNKTAAGRARNRRVEMKVTFD